MKTGAGMSLSLRSVYIGGALVVMGLSVGACTDRQTDISDSHSVVTVQKTPYPRLEGLKTQADQLQNDFEATTHNIASVRTAWDDLRTAADLTNLSENETDNRATNQGVHPYAGLARIKIAQIDYEDGQILPATQVAEQGLEILSAHKAEYMMEITEGIALLSVMYSQSGKVDEALRIQKTAIVDFQTFFETLPEDDKTRAVIVTKSNIEFSHAQALMRVGQSEESIVYQKRSLETRRLGLGADDPDTIRSYYGLAQVLMKAGQLEEAEDFARTAMQKATSSLPENHAAYARSLEMLGIVLSRQGRRLEAVGFLSRALEIKRGTVGVENLYYAYGVHNLGTIFMNLERYEDAETLFLDSDIGFRANQGERSPFAATSLIYAANAAYVLGRYEDALQRLETVLPRLKNEDGTYDESYIFAEITRANIHIKEGSFLKAQRALKPLVGEDVSAQGDGIGIVHARALASYVDYKRSVADAQELRAATLALQESIMGSDLLNETGDLGFEIRVPMETVLMIAADIEQPDLALDIAAMMLSSQISQATHQTTQRVASGDTALAGLLKTQQDAQAKLEQLDKALLNARAQKGDVAVALSHYNQAEDTLKNLNTRLKMEFPKWAELKSDGALSLVEIQKALRPQEVLIGMFPAYSDTFSFVLTHDRVRLSKLKGHRFAHEALIHQVRASIQSEVFDTQGAADLYQVLFPAEIQSLLTNKTHYRLVTAGVFTTLPYSVLITELTQGTTPNWLVSKVAITIEPTLNIRQTTPTLQTSAITFLGVGAPEPFKTLEGQKLAANTSAGTGVSAYFRGGSFNYEALADLPALPGAAQELRDIKKLLSQNASKLLLGKAATEQALTQLDLSKYSLITFATHGLVAGEMDSIVEPALVLSPPKNRGGAFDGILKASEIATFKLRADWVILSACNTAAGNGLNGGGYSGLARAFLYAGAESVLVSHWPVRDDAAAFLTVNTVKNAKAGMSKAQALQTAMLDLMESDLPNASHPAIWAPFVLVGN